ncbi:class I tRNA ligase family protein [Candidatus Vidania fulgoroideorum]
MIDYNIKTIEKKGCEILKKYEKKIINSNRREFYCISMFPYPSGKLHIGHFRNYTLNDFICRYKILKKNKSFVYFGWDSFGLPAENAAIKKNTNPKKWITSNINYMKKQLKKMSIFILWEKEINTSEKEYYSINKKIFMKFLNNKIIYRKKDWVNWDPVDKTVLANEQVINGRGWRSNSLIIKKKVFMYFLKVKKIVNTLYIKTFKLKWPKKVINSQIKWINKKKYYCFILYLDNLKIKVYSLSIFGPFNTKEIIVPFYFKKIYNLCKKYIKKIKKKFLFKKKIYSNKKAYLFFNNKKIKYKIYFFKYNEINKFCFFQDKIYYKNIFKKKIKKYIKINLLKNVKNIFNLKDWSLSRQRKWGSRIPIFYCNKCKTINKKILCIMCKNKNIKETDTLDTFFDSSWYFLKYFYKNPIKKFIKKKIDIYIGGTDHSILHLLYVRIFFFYLKKIKIVNYTNPFKKLLLHGMVKNYSYFSTKYQKYIKKIKYKKNDIIKLEKMSKSKKNGINPCKIIKKYGSDVLRMFIFFLNKPDKDIVWDDRKILGCLRFLKKTWNLINLVNYKNISNVQLNINNLHKNEKKIIEMYKKKNTNKLISILMIQINKIKKLKLETYNYKLFKIIKNFLLFLHPICPLITSVLWEITGNFKFFGSIYENNPF